MGGAMFWMWSEDVALHWALNFLILSLFSAQADWCLKSVQAVLYQRVDR